MRNKRKQKGARWVEFMEKLEKETDRSIHEPVVGCRAPRLPAKDPNDSVTCRCQVAINCLWCKRV